MESAQLDRLRRGVDYWNAWRNENRDEPIDLRAAQLEQANLVGFDLRGADLGQADLRNAVLDDADLSNANLEGAQLSGASVRNTNAAGVTLDPQSMRYLQAGGAYVGDLYGYADAKAAPQPNAPPAEASAAPATPALSAEVVAIFTVARTQPAVEPLQRVLAALLLHPGDARVLLAPFARTPRQLLEAQAAFAPQSSPLTPEPPLPLLQELPEVSQILTRAEQFAHGGEIYPRHLLAALDSDPRVHAFLQQELGTRQLRWIVDTVRDWSPTMAFTEEAVWSAAARAGWRAPGAALRDTVVSRDLLGFKTHVDGLVDVILRPETVPPLVVGVYGPWGSGKSTFMHFVRLGLEERTRSTQKKPSGPRVLTVEYDAWAYADASRIWAGLLARITAHLDAELGWFGRFRYIVARRRRRLVALTLSGLLVGVVLVLAGQVLASSQLLAGGLTDAATSPAARSVPLVAALLGALAQFFQPHPVSAKVESLASGTDSSDAAGVVHKVQAEMTHALQGLFTSTTAPETDAERRVDVDQAIKSGQLKLVIFIDEIDRCPLEKIVDILEAIKLFLAERLFIVIIAMDTRVVSEAIRLRYRGVENPELAREYLEKIVQIPLQVPLGDKDVLQTFVKEFMVVPRTEAPVVVSTAPSQTQTTSEGGPAQPASTANGVPPPTASATQTPSESEEPGAASNPLPDTQFELRTIADLSYVYLDGNPRRVKRLLNTYRFLKILCSARGQDVTTEDWQAAMLAWLVATLRWPYAMQAAVDEATARTAAGGGEEFILPAAVANLVADVELPPALPRQAAALADLGRTAPNFLLELSQSRRQDTARVASPSA